MLIPGVKMGSLELLLYPLSTALIVKIDFEAGTFHGVNRGDILQALGANEDMFVDILLMTGTSFLPTFPALKDSALITIQPYTIKDAVLMYRASGRTIVKVCQQFADALQVQEPEWLDRYRKAKLAVEHNTRVVRNIFQNPD